MIIMKQLILLILITSLAGFAYAETAAEKKCLLKAPGSYEAGKILCDGATSLEPIKCFFEAPGTILEASILCSGANTAAPLACFDQTIGKSISGANRYGAILCSGVTLSNWEARVDCYYKLYGTYRDKVLKCAEKGLKWKKYIDR